MSGSSFTSSVAEVPVLETERLKLRGHRLDDFADCAAMWADAAVTRFIGGKPLSEEEAWTKFLRYAGHWALLGFGYWVAEEKATGKFVGELGFADYKWEIEPSLKGTPEIGWVLAAAFHGKGYATEAVRAVVEWGDSYFINVILKDRTSNDRARRALSLLRMLRRFAWRRSVDTGSRNLRLIKDTKC